MGETLLFKMLCCSGSHVDGWLVETVEGFWQHVLDAVSQLRHDIYKLFCCFRLCRDVLASSGCLKKGRPRQGHLEIVKAQWHIARNAKAGRQLSKLAPTDNRLPCYFQCLCDKDHCVYILLATIHKKKEQAFQCRVCAKQHKSGLECHIWGVLGKRTPPVFWVPEARILRGKFAAADAYLPDHNLAIQIDGAQHLGTEFAHQKAKKGKPQWQKDAEFNEACAKQGYHLLRTHADDVKKGSVVLGMAIDRCSKANGTLRLFSRAYVGQAPSWECVVQCL